jgi:tripeptide aminopeptidase
MGPVGKAANSAPTIISFRAEFTGKAAHAGFAPEGGIHAINAAARAINAMPSGRVGDATINVGTVSGGTARNIIPDKCEFTGEIRSLSDASAQALLSRAHEITKAAAQEFGAELNFVSADCVTAYATPTEHPVCRRFESACAALGLNADIAPTLGGSDNNCLAQHGIAGIVVANAMNDCHSCAESTEQAELVRAAELALQLMLSKE